MRIVRLAQLLEHKYNLKAVAGPADDEAKINDVRRDLMDAWSNYFDPNTVKPAYNILPYLAGYNEKYSLQIIALMKDMMPSVKSGDLYGMFDGIQSVLAVINKLQEGEAKVLRQSIDDSIPRQRETDRNRQMMAKSKFENTVFKKLASLLKKIGERINRMLGKSTPLAGGPTEPQVKEPTKQEQTMFRLCPLAVAHHLDNPEIFAKLWTEYPDLKRRLIRVMNRGKNRWATLHLDPEIKEETDAIMAEFIRREKENNQPYFEAGEDAAKEMARPKWFTPTPEQKREKEEALRNAPVPMSDAEYIRMHQEKALQQRLEDAKKYQQETNPLRIQDEEEKARKEKEIEEDRERLLRQESGLETLLNKFAKRYQ